MIQSPRIAKVSVIIALLIFLSFGIFSYTTSALQPSGSTTTVISTSTALADSPGNNSAIAGNVTEINLVGFTTTQSWQGYYGNVSGTIQLADAQDNVLYNWSVTEPSGEVYASTNSSFNWLNVQCFNFTAEGNLSNNLTAGEIAGATNLFGTNLSQLEFQYNISSDDYDGVNDTFTLLGSGHDTFFTANLLFSDGECRSTRVFGSTGQGVSNQFEEALLYEPVTHSVIFTSILEEGVLNGFDAHDHDFEMLVLENGHGTDVTTTLYYFFIEIE